VDALQGAGGSALKVCQKQFQFVVIRPDGGTGFRPGLPHTLGYSGRNDSAGDSFR
jgi:hypothetical protein